MLTELSKSIKKNIFPNYDLNNPSKSGHDKVALPAVTTSFSKVNPHEKGPRLYISAEAGEPSCMLPVFSVVFT